jgi:hypothetical protein
VKTERTRTEGAVSDMPEASQANGQTVETEENTPRVGDSELMEAG